MFKKTHNYVLFSSSFYFSLLAITKIVLSQLVKRACTLNCHVWKKCLITHFSPAVMVHVFLSAITKTVLCQLDKTPRAKLPYLKKRIITHFPSVAMIRISLSAIFMTVLNRLVKSLRAEMSCLKETHNHALPFSCNGSHFSFSYY